MIYELVDAEVVMVCKRCGFQSKLGALPHPHGVLNFCPECVKSWKGSVMIGLEEYLEQMLKEKMRRHIYCVVCGFTGLISAFPQNGPQDSIDSEQYCPRCINVNDLINASEVKFCKDASGV